MRHLLRDMRSAAAAAQEPGVHRCHGPTLPPGLRRRRRFQRRPCDLPRAAAVSRHSAPRPGPADGQRPQDGLSVVVQTRPSGKPIRIDRGTSPTQTGPRVGVLIHQVGASDLEPPTVRLHAQHRLLFFVNCRDPRLVGHRIRDRLTGRASRWSSASSIHNGETPFFRSSTLRHTSVTDSGPACSSVASPVVVIGRDESGRWSTWLRIVRAPPRSSL